MAGQATELFNLATSFDPYGAYRQGEMKAQKYDIQQAMLDEQTKEIEADKAQSLAQQTGQAGQPVALAKMSNQMIPDAKLYNDDGTLTTAGQMNEVMVNSSKLAKQAKMMGMQASLIEDPYQRTQAMAEARRLGQTAQADAIKAREMNDKVKNDSIYAAAMAKDQTQWDAAIKAYQDSGLPLPKGIPTEYTPENAKKIMAMAPAALQSKINNDQLKQKQEDRLVKSAELRDQKMAAKERDGDSGAKLTAESDKRLNQAETGLKLVNNIEGLLANETVRKEFDKNQFLRTLLEQPKEMTNIDKYIKSSIYQTLSPETKDLITLLANTRNAYYRQNSGQAVTGGEAARNFFSVVQPSDNAETIIRKINQQKPQYTDALQAGIDDYKLTSERKKRYSGLIESSSKKEATTEAPPSATPTQADLDYIEKNPSLESKFVKRFGKKPSEFKKSK